MKVLMILGSPRQRGNTELALNEMKAVGDAKEKYGLPEREEGIFTNFVR